ncbi:UNVERIFIED_CONTAM: hypothetical protein FKN15_067173 [Acipenser sinensis]
MNLEQNMYDRVQACEACVVISETVKKVFMYVVLSDHCIYLTENPTKTIQAAVHFKDISRIELDPRKTEKERWIKNWEGASMSRGCGLVGESSAGIKRPLKGVGTQCDQEGEVTGPSRADVTPFPLNIPDMWD